MKTLFRKYSFAALSISAICLFFVLTGGVYDSNSTALNPPTIEFVTAPNSSTVGNSNTFTFLVSHGTNPTTYMVKETCEFPPAPPLVTEKESPNPSPQIILELRKNGSVVYTAPKNTIIADTSLSYGAIGWKTSFTWANSFAHPGTYELVCSARAVSKTVEKYNNGSYSSGGELYYSGWTTSTKTITITGTAPMPIAKYTFKNLAVIPANTDPAPPKTWAFSDPNNQYIEIINEFKANMKFKWTPPAGDLALYPNLTSSYDFNYTNADYNIYKYYYAGGLSYYLQCNLSFQGQVIRFEYDESMKRLSYQRPSKTIPNGFDKILIELY